MSNPSNRFTVERLHVDASQNSFKRDQTGTVPDYLGDDRCSGDNTPAFEEFSSRETSRTPVSFVGVNDVHVTGRIFGHGARH